MAASHPKHKSAAASSLDILLPQVAAFTPADATEERAREWLLKLLERGDYAQRKRQSRRRFLKCVALRIERLAGVPLADQRVNPFPNFGR